MDKRSRLPYGNKRSWLSVPIAAAVLFGAAALPLYAGTTQIAHAEISLSHPSLQLRTMQFQVNGSLLDVPAGISADNETFVALSFLSKKLGLTTSWDAISKKISVSGKNKTMEMHAGSSEFHINGHLIYGTPPIVLKGTTYLPLRFLLEQMGFTIGYDAATKVITIKPIVENDLKLTNKTLKHVNGNKSVTIQYPQLQGFSGTDVQAKINAFLEAEATRHYKSGQSLLNEAEEDGSAGTADQAPPLSYDVNYTITYNEQNKLSLHFDVYEYTGGAHGMYDWQSHTFDLGTGEELTLQNAALNNPDYLNIANTEIKKQIKQRDIFLNTPFESIRPDQGFFLRGNAIVIYFSLYEYTPYAEGIPEFSMPLSLFAK